MFRLHFNKTNGIFSVRRSDRSTVCSSERRAKLPAIGDTIALAPRVHLIITRNDFKKAMTKSCPVLSVAVTRFPFIRLLIERVKEVVWKV